MMVATARANSGMVMNLIRPNKRADIESAFQLAITGVIYSGDFRRPQLFHIG